MSVNNVYTLGPIAVSHASTNDFNIDGIVDMNVSPEVAQELLYGAGVYLPTHVHVQSVAPMIGFSCTDLATVLAAVDPDSGLAINSGGSAYDLLTLYFTKATNLGTRAGSGAHISVVANLALIVPRSLTLQQGQTAVLQSDIYVIYDGSNNPFVYSQAASLPHVPSIDEAFTLGPVVANGAEIDGVQRVTIDFGNEVSRAYGGGDVFPTHVHIMTHGPTIEIATKDVGTLDDFGLTGTAINSSDIIIYAKKYANEGVYIADNVAEHVKFTLDKGTLVPGGAGGANNTDSEATVRVRPIYDGTNHPLVIDTASAIT